MRSRAQDRVRGGHVYRITLAMVALSVLFVVGAVGAAAQTTTAPNCADVGYNGSGTSADPYQVGNVSQLQCIENQGLGDEYVLVSDINATGTDQWNSGNGFAPIGSSSTPFDGALDGDGYSITGLTVNRSGTNRVGVFSTVGSAGTVRDVTLVDLSVSGNDRVGGLVGYNNGRMERVDATGNVTTGGSIAGGLVGTNDGGSELIDSTVAVDVEHTATGESTAAVGGAVGGNQDRGTIENVTANGDVSVTSGAHTGGLIGFNDGDINSSSATGNVSASSTGPKEIGGLVGHNDGGQIRSSDASGAVSGGGDQHVGGLAGKSGGFDGGTIERSYATGDVNAPNSSAVGGLVGNQGDSFYNNGTVRASYATGDVTGDDKVGAVTGANYDRIERTYGVGSVAGNTDVGGLGGLNDGTVQDSYWDVNTTNQTGSAGGTGLTTDQLKANSSLGGFDFTNTWDVVDNDSFISYPFLRSNTQDPAPGLQELFYAGGDGSTSSPYLIENWNHLDNVRENLSANYTVVNDLNETTLGYDDVANGTANDGNGFVPIGNFSNRFTGTFNGSNNEIEGLFIDRPNTAEVGPFGFTQDATIENVGMVGLNVTGENKVGGLVGENDGGNVSGSYATGNVTAEVDNVGGLVGENDGGNVSESYATGNVTGNNIVGGLVGTNRGDVNESYATGNVTGDDAVGGLVGFNDGGDVSESYATGTVTGNNRVGGLVGFNDGGGVNDSYWDVNTTNQKTSDGGTGLTTRGMKGDVAKTKMSGFDFTATWSVVDTSDRISYPFLSNNTQTPAPGKENRYAGGDGTSGSPYEIANWYHLDDTRRNLGANFTVVNDLNETTLGYDDVANTTANSGDGFAPVGEITAPFKGTFDGQNNTIEGMVIDRPSEDKVGLFGQVGSEGVSTDVSRGEVSNVGVVDADISADGAAGALIGVSFGNVTNSYATGNVSGNASSGIVVGGLVGQMNGSVSDSYAVVNVSGDGFVGGLIGDLRSGNVTDSYATGNVSGNSELGGLIGDLSGNVTDSYATGDVTSDDDRAGGLVGLNVGTVSSSSASGNVTSTGDAGFLAGQYLGGFVGDNAGTVTDSTATGDVASPISASSEDAIVGGFAGRNDGAGTLTNVSAIGDTSGGALKIGGLVGRNAGTVTASSASGKVNGTNNAQEVGGLVGFNNDGAIVTESEASGDVDGELGETGGLVGVNRGTVGLSDAAGDVSNGDDKTGGLVGENNGGTVTESYATGNVSGNNRVGGLVGLSSGTVSSDAVINDSYATGDVSDTFTAAGLVGSNQGGSTVERSYAVGFVGGDSDGLAGFNGGNINDSYWDVEATNQTGSAGGTALTTEEMTGGDAPANMEGFDFVGTWYATEGYPVLARQGAGPLFDVNVTGTNSPINATETLRVTANVTNFGGETTTQIINFTDTEFNNTERDGVSVALAEGASNGSIALEWNTSSVVNGTGNVTVASENETDTANVTVRNACLSLEPVGGASNPPTDTDGDGVCEDLSGDGDFDLGDVIALYDNFEEDSTINNNVRFFDFNGDSSLSLGDVISLYNGL